MNGMTNAVVEQDFVFPRLLQGDKFASTTARLGSVGLRDGLGLLVACDGIGTATVPPATHVVPTDGYVRDRSPMADVQGVAARGAPV